jgi:hypothetical protein
MLLILKALVFQVFCVVYGSVSNLRFTQSYVIKLHLITANR